jgi:hypothetical protein
MSANVLIEVDYSTPSTHIYDVESQWQSVVLVEHSVYSNFEQACIHLVL